MNRPRRPTRAGRISPRAAGPGIPSARVRRARGPTPPDHVLRPLVAYLEGRDGSTRTDARAFPALGTRWRTLLTQARAAIVRHARRGVVQVLRGARRLAALGAPTTPPEDWVGRITEAVRAAIRPGNDIQSVLANIRRAVSLLDSAILAEHTAMIRHISVAAGVAFYVWTTRRDTLVRPLHLFLEGKVQSWASPPVSGTNGFRGHPGEPAKCRCVPWPLDPDIYGALLANLGF